MPQPILGTVSENAIGLILGTKFHNFASDTGIYGLFKDRDNGSRLDLLAVAAEQRGNGSFRRFMFGCKRQYKTICVWDVHNDMLKETLLRYGFIPFDDIDSDCGEKMIGFRWDSDDTIDPATGVATFRYGVEEK